METHSHSPIRLVLHVERGSPVGRVRLQKRPEAKTGVGGGEGLVCQAGRR